MSPTEQITNLFHGRKIYPIEYEILNTNMNLNAYYIALYFPQFFSEVFSQKLQALNNTPENEKNLLIQEIIEHLLSEHGRVMGIKELLIAHIKKYQEYAPQNIMNVIDIASGSSMALDELKGLIENFKGVRLDLHTKLLKNKQTHAVAGDVLELPFKDYSTAMVYCRGLLTYLLEEPNRTELINARNEIMEVENKLKKNFDAILDKKLKELQIKSKEAAGQLNFLLVEKLLSEIYRVLIPMGQARIDSLFIHHLFIQNKQQYNAERIKKFMAMLEPFSLARFYKFPYNYLGDSGAYSLSTHINYENTFTQNKKR